jgi:sulfate adenylyltransferase
MNGWVLPEEVLREAPTYAPRSRELADLELLLSGALAPLTGFPTRADLEAIGRTGQLADGTPWPVRLTLEVPSALTESLDPGNPLKRGTAADRPGRHPAGRHRRDGRVAGAGRLVRGGRPRPPGRRRGPRLVPPAPAGTRRDQTAAAARTRCSA